MSKQLDTKEILQRVLAVTEILSTVATTEEIRAVNQGTTHNITPLSVQREDNRNQQPQHQEVQE